MQKLEPNWNRAVQKCVILCISSRAFKRVFIFKNRLRYSRERASQSLQKKKPKVRIKVRIQVRKNIGLRPLRAGGPPRARLDRQRVRGPARRGRARTGPNAIAS